MAAELQITDGGAGTLELSGELDTHTAPQLADRLAELTAGSRAVLDLAGVTFISSAGLSAILNAQRRLEQSSGSLTVSNPTPSVERMIALSGLTETFGLA
jgi:anti-anti-sigma factor